MSQHRDEFLEVKSYFSDVTHSNLDLIRSLKVFSLSIWFVLYFHLDVFRMK